ncbi:MAG: ATP-binding cassette domain-containing protein [Desulfobacterota bacterium]|jgi:phospholipid/cholesterol/gamma-HCH transport system ATP-binding protein|nr:ATP-binding cassette domain-containing protein [Thermodesulfobacteriota bacterium]
MIKIEDLHKSFNGVAVLKGVSLEVEKGELLALIGRSGYGKSVLLKHVAGLLRPDRGRILLEGQDMGRLRGSELVRVRNRLGFLFQSGALFDSMTILDNVAFPLREKTKLSEPEIRKKAMVELEQVDLLGSEEKYPSQISGGMVKRASLARALVEEPEIMLIDEPTTGLDPLTGQTILNLIDACHKRLGFSGIMVTHEVPKIFEIVNKVVMLHEGRVIFSGTPEEILASEDATVRTFVAAGAEWSTHDAAVCAPMRQQRKKDIHAL